MEFFKFPPEALKEWAALDKDPDTTDTQLKTWYRTWLTKVQNEVVMNDSPGNLLDELIKQYRVTKQKRKDDRDKLMKELSEELQKTLKIEPGKLQGMDVKIENA